MRPYWQVKPAHVTTYQASYTLTKFHLATELAPTAAAPSDEDSGAQVKGILGPLGSGKSVGCCWDLMMMATQFMPPDSDGARRSRWAVVRNTYRELEDTTLQTWWDWFPEQRFGEFLRRGMTHRVRRPLADGTRLELDVMFRALDKPQDVRKLLSMEITGAFINEAREMPLAVLDMIRKRCGRFPKWGSVPPYWFGVIMDTNPPDESHWWYRYAEIEHPPRFVFFRQPSGRSPQAENLQHLPPGYYSTAGYSAAWIKVYIDGEYGYILSGLPVYPEFYEQTHFVPDLRPIPNLSITVGLDFGLTPAAVFIQQDVRGRFLVIDELCAQNMGIVNFAKLLKAHIQAHYQGFEFRFVGDPAGDQRDAIDEEDTVFKALRRHGINARPCFTQEWTMRRDAVSVPLSTLVDGRPQLMIGAKAQMVRQGLAGKYHYKLLQVKAIGDEKRYHNQPDKNDYSHPCEALQYGLLGAGSNPMRPKPIGSSTGIGQVPIMAQTDFDIWQSLPAPWVIEAMRGRYPTRFSAPR